LCEAEAQLIARRPNWNRLMTRPPRKPGKPACSICGDPVHADYRSFCSRRCADIDLGRWLKGSYAIPGSPANEADDLPNRDSDDRG
jgi:endogenous inhibitor of DNA gyrase (YacG/DUF329 family)